MVNKRGREGSLAKYDLASCLRCYCLRPTIIDIRFAVFVYLVTVHIIAFICFESIDSSSRWNQKPNPDPCMGLSFCLPNSSNPRRKQSSPSSHVDNLPLYRSQTALSDLAILPQHRSMQVISRLHVISVFSLSISSNFITGPAAGYSPRLFLYSPTFNSQLAGDWEPLIGFGGAIS